MVGKRYSKSTLMRMNKSDLVEQLLCAYHNEEVLDEFLEQQAKNVKDWMPVVHCKDCVHFKLMPDVRGNEYPACVQERGGELIVSRWVNEDGFCDWGERKKDNV